MSPVIWHGDLVESLALSAAIERNCTCTYNPDGARAMTCVPHKALLEDQHFLDYLIFYRRLKDRLIAEEWLRKPRKEAPK